MKKTFRTWFWAVTTLFAVLAFTFATLAWFTANRAVQTNTATARTGDETLELQISSSGGSSFKSVETAQITQVNQTNSEFLLPVSTADLNSLYMHHLPKMVRLLLLKRWTMRPIIIMAGCICGQKEKAGRRAAG